ncbi:MAG: DUF2333 family protein [Gammaproteobacteria bacterium]|nr:DUF2333 family protein [Gammaproteobacteria bacterium]
MNATLIRRGLLALVGLWAIVCVVLAFWWSHEPEPFDPVARAEARAEAMGREPVTGFTTTATLIELAETLLEKRGGFLSDDVFPPGVLLDNVPNWEFGVLVQVRDMARVMRNDLSRSQSQSAEDPDLANAEGKFFFDNSSWMFPQSESEYRAGIELMESYLRRLSDPQQSEAQFYARADNLRAWLDAVGTRMGSLSQRLAAAAGERRVDLGLAGDPAATQSTGTRAEGDVRTPWTEIDDVFYQARGRAWALLHLLRAAERDFESVLRNKNALVSLRQIIRDLEPTQKPLWSPVILNGGGFGMLANHSLVMASHVARANAAIIDLRNLLSEG